MSKTKRLLSLLAGLGGEVTVRDVSEARMANGDTRIDITVDHPAHPRPCDACGSECVKKYGLQEFNAWHIPQGARRPSRVICRRQRFKCLACGRTFMEDIPWLYGETHMTVPLAERIADDLRTIMTRKDIARVSCVSTHYVDVVVSGLTPPVPARLPEVLCLDETFSHVGGELDGNAGWIKFVTNLSDGQTGELLDILPFRTKRRLVRYFKEGFPHGELCKVRHLCCDGAKFYMELAGACFPNADVCLDNFHVTKRLHMGMFSVRTKQQGHLLSKSGALNDRFHREYVDLKRLSHKLLTSHFHQRAYWGDSYDRHAGRIRHHLGMCPELKDAYAMLQYFYGIFHSSYDCDERIRDLDTWISIFGKSTSEAIASTVESVAGHLPLIHNAWRHGHSNAVCEGNNNVIQTLRDVSFGVHSFDYLRTRSLLILGRPGVARAVQKAREPFLDCSSFFFDDFPSLEDYVLAYDWACPHVDLSRKGG